MKALTAAMTSVLALACTSPGPSAQHGNHMPTRLQFEILDGGLARTVAENGLANGLQPFMSGDALLLWPGTEVIAGTDRIIDRLRQVPWLDSAVVTWQPLRIHEDGDPSLVLSQVVISMSGKSGERGNYTVLGRGLMVWGGDSTDFRVRALLLSSLQVPPLPTPPGAAPAIGEVTETPWEPLPGAEPIARADSSLRSDVERDGPAEALGRWLAPTGNTTAGNGRLNIGRDEVVAALGAIDSVSAWQMRAAGGGVSARGNLGWTHGTIAIRSKRAVAGARAAMWHYMLFWERQADGEFRIVTAATNPWQPATLEAPDQRGAP